MLIPVSQLLADSPQYGELIRRAAGDNENDSYDCYYDRLKRVHDIRQYAIPVISVESDDYEEIAEIFARVNQGGRRLSKGDLVYSAIAARWSDGLDTVERFMGELDRAAFRLDREAILRLMGLIAGTGAHAIKLIHKEMTGDELKSAWAETESAVRHAVDFLRDECRIPRSAVLTSPNVAVIPAYLLHRRKGSLTDDEVRLLRRWVYTAMAFSHYSNQVESKLDAEARLCREKSGTTLFDDLIRRASGPRSTDTPLSPDDLAGRSSKSPFFALLYIAALRGGAKDWVSNSALSTAPMTSTSQIEYHHVFPKARVQPRYGKDATNNLANLAFISGAANRKIGAKKPEDYFRTLDQRRLSEQWITSEERLWLIPAFEQFLDDRRLRMAQVLNDLLGLPRYRPGRPRSIEAALPFGDEELGFLPFDTVDEEEESEA
jgi:hypothetical protein